VAGRDPRRLPAAAAAAYTLLAVAVLAALVALSLAPDERQRVGDALGAQLPLLLVGGGLALAGLAGLVGRLVGRHAAAVRRLTAETRLLLEANPDHVPGHDGPPEVAALAEAVGQLAERRLAAEREVAEQVAAARAGLEQERNQLATLMAELAVAVVVCNAEGRILLYNAAARSLLDDDAAVGIGRTVFGLVDRELVDHALARLSAGAAGSHTATAVHRGRALEVQVAAVRDGAGEVAGFVLLLDELTDRLAAARRRADSVRSLTETARARLGNVRAAIEAVLGFPDMSAEERERFLRIVEEESRLLGDEVDRWTAGADELAGSEWPLAEIAAGDLLVLLSDAVRSAGVDVDVVPPPTPLWLRVESHAVSRSLTHLAAKLAGLSRECTMSVERAGAHAQLELAWTGEPVTPAALDAWVDEPLAGSAAASVREVVARHGGELWAGSAGGVPHLRLLLPLAAEPGAPAPSAETHRPAMPVGSRPEFYDFDLFARSEVGPDARDQPLATLACTVFDTETTGLDPARGDEIVALGAVRVVNGRLLRSECFGRLVDPRRDVPATSTAVHGLTRSMLEGQPGLEEVLPEFARYAADTVLVGHNVGFDLQFLRLREDRTGVAFRQPALDTLLLDAVVHADHDDHSLEAIAGRLGVPVTGRHSALGDALVTGEVYLRLLPLLAARGIRTLGDALAASQATLHARLDRRMYGG
jgi:DNA polymerase-3 subunit epsilon